MKEVILKTTIAILFTSISFFTFGQQSEYNSYWNWEYRKSQYQPIVHKTAKNVEQVNYTIIRKNKESKYVKRFNDSGKLVSYSSIDKDQKEIPIGEFEYDKNSRLIVSKSYHKGEIKSTTFKTLTERGKITELKKVNSKEAIILRNTWEYNSDSCLSKSIRYGKKDKIHRTWKYEYFGKCQKSKTTLYKGNAKVKNVWSYDCKEEGSKLEKRKNETQVCKWEKSTEQYLIKVYQTFDEKGRIRKYVSKYTMADTLIFEHSTFDGNDELIRKTTYDKSFNKPLVSTSFRKGKKTYESIYKYENDLIVSRSHSYKDKHTSKYEYTYENSLLTELKVYNKKGVLSTTIKLDYKKRAS